MGGAMKQRMAGRERYAAQRPGRAVASVQYNYDSVARQLVPTEEQRAEREDRLRARRAERIARRRERQALHMDLPYLMMLTAATCAALFICCSYIRVQSGITASMRNIETQEEQLEALKSENDALQTAINTDVDLDHIYEVATNELGMVYADRNQVIRYKKTESEYVRQYEDIPGAAER